MMGLRPGMMGGGFSIIFWILIIAVAYYLFKEYKRDDHHRHDRHDRYDRYNDRNNSGPVYKKHDYFESERKNNQNMNEDNAKKIAKQRYAKGEISKEEYQELKNELSN